MPVFVEYGEKCYICDQMLKTEAVVWANHRHRKCHHRCSWPLRGLKRMMPERVEERVTAVQKTHEAQSVHREVGATVTL